MLGIAILLGVIALPTVVIDVRLAGVFLLGGAALAVAGLASGRSAVAGVLALVLVAGAAGLAAWETWELNRPAPAGATGAIDPAPYSRPGIDREVILPLTVAVEDVKRLALLEFDAGEDPVYDGFEPQFIDRGHERGYRVIAYRHDGYVDVFDDLALTPEPDVSMAVAGSGMRGYSHQDLGEPTISRDEQGRATIAFSLTDTAGRAVSCHIRESTTRRSVPLNLLAPIGTGSVSPDAFPLFLLDGFEFLRIPGTAFDLTIDGEPRRLAGFPVPIPIQGQQRSFAKYSLDTDIISVFPTAGSTLERVHTTGDTYERGGATYLFAGDALERIRMLETEIAFEPALDVAEAGAGRFTITSHPGRGVVGGPYSVSTAGETSELTLAIDQVNLPRQRGIIYRLVVSDSSMFGQWPRHYSYRATIDRAAGTVEAEWTNAQAG